MNKIGTDSEMEIVVTIIGKRIFWNNLNENRKSPTINSLDKFWKTYFFSPFNVFLSCCRIHPMTINSNPTGVSKRSSFSQVWRAFDQWDINRWLLGEREQRTAYVTSRIQELAKEISVLSGHFIWFASLRVWCLGTSKHLLETSTITP